jgi:fucose permease
VKLICLLFYGFYTWAIFAVVHDWLIRHLGQVGGMAVFVLVVIVSAVIFLGHLWLQWEKFRDQMGWTRQEEGE